jgi:hypothetical protein
MANTYLQNSMLSLLLILSTNVCCMGYGSVRYSTSNFGGLGFVFWLFVSTFPIIIVRALVTCPMLRYIMLGGGVEC